MKRILVIDDDVQMRLMLRRILERAGYEVVDASDGNEGIRLYHQAPTDLIMCDIIMPEKEGVETIIEFRRDFPDAKIIAISGGGRGIKPANCLDAIDRLGADCAFSKPFDRKEILDAVQGLLNGVPVKSQK